MNPRPTPDIPTTEAPAMTGQSSNARLFLIHAHSPLHAGVGESTGAINLPTARERFTEMPYLPGSSIKGVLRQEAEASLGNTSPFRDAFGPPSENAADHRGGLVFSDASLLALPVRSLYGTFAWLLSPLVLRRLCRDLGEAGAVPEALSDLAKSMGGGTFAGLALTPGSALEPAPPKEDPTPSRPKDDAKADRAVYLEDLRFEAPETSAELEVAAQWLADALWPGEAHALDREDFTRRVAFVSDDTLTYFARFGLEVRARVKMNPETGTAASSGPWTEEHLPAETLLFGLILGRRSRGTTPQTNLATLTSLLKGGRAVTFGGKTTYGMGRARMTLVGGGQ